MDEFLYFYLAHLIDAEGSRLASEEIWIADLNAPENSPEKVALTAVSYMNAEQGTDPNGCTVRLFGPFTTATPSHIFAITDDNRDDAPDYWTATDVNAPPAPVNFNSGDLVRYAPSYLRGTSVAAVIVGPVENPPFSDVPLWTITVLEDVRGWEACAPVKAGTETRALWHELKRAV